MHFEDLLEEVGSFGLYQKLLCFILIPFTTGICALVFYTQIFILTAPLHTCRLQVQDESSGIARNAHIQQLEFLNQVGRLLNNTLVDSDDRHPFACHQYDVNATLTWSSTSQVNNLTSLNQLPPPTEACVNSWEYDGEFMFSTYTSEMEPLYDTISVDNPLRKIMQEFCQQHVDPHYIHYAIHYYLVVTVLLPGVGFTKAVTIHDFVCEEAWRPYMVATAFWVGNTIGSWIFGFVSDMYGRRPTVLLSHLVYGAAGLASVFVSNFYGFLFLRIMVGFAHHTVSHLPFVLVVEYCGLKSRTIPLLTIMMTYTIGSILTPVLAWLIWDWRILAILSSVPALFILLLCKWVPESSSWLIARAKRDAAKAQLETVAKVNKREVPYQMLSQLLTDMGNDDAKGPESPGTHADSDDKEFQLKEMESKASPSGNASTSVVHILRYPSLRKNVFMVLIVWMMSCMCYYGHCQNTANLSNNVFLSYLLGAVVEIPAWSAPWLINKYGRRKPLILAFFIAGIAGLLYSVLPQDITWLALATALLGRASITGAYYITLQYGPEIFPTVVRGQGVALSETLGGVAIFLSPSIVYLGEFHKPAPLLVFGGLSILAGVATLLLPETAGVVLPQTLHQAEVFSRQSQFTLPCCSKSDAEVREKSRPVNDAVA